LFNIYLLGTKYTENYVYLYKSEILVYLGGFQYCIVFSMISVSIYHYTNMI